MPWCLEKPELNNSDITWLQIDSNHIFILEQKLKDVSTPRNSRSKHSRCRSGSGSYNIGVDRILIEVRKYKLNSKNIPDSLVQFRIRTIENITREKTSLVIAVDLRHNSILYNWNIVKDYITPELKKIGLDNNLPVNYSLSSWYEFLIFQIYCLSILSTNSEDKSIKNKDSTILSIDNNNDNSKKPARKVRVRASTCNNKTINIIRRATTSPLHFSQNVSLDNNISQAYIQELLQKQITLPSSISIENNLLHMQNCIIITINNKENNDTSIINQIDNHQLRIGILLLYTEHLGFYLRPPAITSNQLKLKLADIEQLTFNPQIDTIYPSSLSILHNSRKQYVFVGLDEKSLLAQKLVKLWDCRQTKLKKELRSRLKNQTYVPKVDNSNTPNSKSKIFSFFNRKKNEEDINIVSIVPGITKLPLFSIAPFIRRTASSEKCEISIDEFFEFPFHGKFYLTESGGIFISKKNALMIIMNYCNIISIEYIDTIHSDNPCIKIELKTFSYDIILSNLSQDLTNLWIREWLLTRESYIAEDLLYYSKFDDEHDKLFILKQKYMSTQIPETIKEHKIYWDEYYKLFANANLRTDILQRLIYLGIPNELRGKWWCILLEVNEKRKAIDEIPYGYLLAHYRSKKSMATIEIKRDVERSLPEHDYYKPKAEGCNVLESVLRTYSWRNSSIGYCQSMNLICALLLLYMSEEDAYTVLCIICEDLLPNYYTPIMDGSLTDQKVLCSLIEECLPKIHNKLTELNVPITVITLPWFLCLFIQTIPWSTNLRILDLFFAFGRKILFQIALAIFKLNEEAILLCTDSTEVIFTIKDTLEHIEPDPLIEQALQFYCISLKHIDLLWTKYHSEILIEIENQGNSTNFDDVNPQVVPIESPRKIEVRNNNKKGNITRIKSFQLLSTEKLRRVSKKDKTDILSVLEEFQEDYDSEIESDLSTLLNPCTEVNVKFNHIKKLKELE